MLQNFWLWRLTADIEKSELLKMIETKDFLRLTPVYPTSKEIVFDCKTPQGRSTSSGRHTYWSQVIICSCLIRRRRTILENYRTAYQPCLTSFDIITRRQRDIKPEVIQFCPTNIDYISYDFCSGRLKVSTHVIDLILGFQHPQSGQISSLFCAFVAFQALGAKAASIGASLSQALCNGHLHTFAEPTDDEISAIEALKARLMELLLLSFPRMHVDLRIDTDACRKHAGCCLFYKQPSNTDRTNDHWSFLLYNTELA